MKNRFNINEEEKARIRGLHNIKEQWEKVDIEEGSVEELEKRVGDVEGEVERIKRMDEQPVRPTETDEQREKDFDIGKDKTKESADPVSRLIYDAQQMAKWADKDTGRAFDVELLKDSEFKKLFVRIKDAINDVKV